MSALKRPALVGSLLVRKGAAAATGQSAQPISEVMRETPRTVVALPKTPRLKSTHAPRMPEKRFGRQKPLPVAIDEDSSAAKKMRLTLGLDPQLHLRLKLAAVHDGTNMRSLIITAIETHLAALGPKIQGGRCACLQSGSLHKTCADKLAGPVDGTDQH